VAVVLVQRGNGAGELGDATVMGGEAVLLQMPSGRAELADVDDGARFDLMALSFTPCALIAEPLVRPIPWTFHHGLDTGDGAGVHGRSGGGEGVVDVVAEVAVGVRPGKVTSGLSQLEAIIRELLPEVHKLAHPTDYLCSGRVVANDLGLEGVVLLLLHGPVHTGRVHLSVSK
jgi:hypothetical protein